MAQGRSCVVAAVALSTAALVFAGSAAAGRSCSARVLEDWQDGRIGLTYPVECYRSALARLPEDMRVYSSAKGDITRALQARVAKLHRARAGRAHGGGVVSPLLVVAITAAVLAAAGSVAAVLR